MAQTNTNVSELLGIGLPNIYISNITLSNSIDLPRSKQDPHIDHPNEISEPSLKDIQEANDNTALQVSLKMVFKETINADGNFSFLNNNDVLNYVKVAIVQCLNEDVSDQISKNPKQYLNPKTGTVFNQSNSQSSFKVFKQGLAESIQGYDQLVLDAMQNLMTSDGELTLDAIKKQTEVSALMEQMSFSKEQDSNGNDVYNIPLELKAMISPSQGGANVKFLSYFAYAYFDIEAFIDDSKSQLGSAFDNIPIPEDVLNEYIMGNISSDIVILNGNTQEDSYVFVDGDGKYYTGPKHQMLDGTYMKGKVHLQGKTYNPKDYLTKKTVPNAKIIDNRQSVAIGMANFNYAKVSEYLTNDDVIIGLMENLGTADLIKVKFPIASELMTCHDIGGKNRFTFSINMHNLLHTNTTFPGLLKTIKDTNEAEYASLLEKVEIKKLKIQRRRLKKNQTITSSFKKTSFSKSEIPLLIVSTQDQNGKLQEKLQLSDGLTPVTTDGLSKVGTLSEVFVKHTNLGIRTFTGTDIEVSSKHEGVYEYSLEIQAVDPMHLYIRGKIDSLQKILDQWTKYVNLANRPHFSDDILNRFTVHFLSVFNKQFGNNSIQDEVSEAPSFVTDTVQQYMTTLFLMNSNEDKMSETIKFVKMFQYLVNISSPSTGSPDGVLLVANLIQDFIQKLENVLKQVETYSKLKTVSSNPKVGIPQIAGASAQKTFDFNHTFKEHFEAKPTSLSVPIGYDFLSNSSYTAPANLSGLRYLTTKEVNQRFLSETKKLFSSQNADIIIKTAGSNPTIFNPGDTINNQKFAFLAPSFVYLPRRKPYPVLSNGSLVNEDLNAMSDLMLDVVRYNNDPSSGFTSADIKNAKNIDLPEKVQKRRLDLVQYFSEKGCVLEAPEAEAESNISLVPPSFGPITTFGNANVAIFSTPFTTEAQFGSKFDDDFFEEMKAQQEYLSIAGNEIVNSTINPNKLLYSLTVLDDLNFIDKTLEENERINSLLYYRVNSPNGGKVFKDATFAYALISAVANLTGNENQIDSQTPIAASPNHVKSLILTAMKRPAAASSSLKKTIEEKKKDGFKDPMYYGYLNFNYRILNKIEVFRGFDSGQTGAFVSSAKFSTLKESDISPENLTSNEVLLCRQRRYTDTINGTMPPKLLEMPYYDEYFFITPDDVVANLNLNTNAALIDSVGTLSVINQGGTALALQAGVIDSSLETAAAKKEAVISSINRNYQPAPGKEMGALRVEYTNSNPLREGSTAKENSRVPFVDRPNRKEEKLKMTTFQKLTRFEQTEMLRTMGLTKLANLNNINANVSEQRTNGQITTREDEFTAEERKILENFKASIKGDASKTSSTNTYNRQSGARTTGGTSSGGGGSTY
jgi:hypothetical protein